MRKFLKVCHIISRIFIFLCVASALVLLFLRPEGLGFGPAPTTDGSFWKVFATTLGLAAVMFAASDWAYRLLEDNDFLEVLSSSILKPAFDRHDLSDKRFHKTSANELDFNASLRAISDGKERTLQELAWEKKNNKQLQKKTVGNGIVSLIFFLLGLLFLVYPIVMYFLTGQVLALPGADILAYVAVAAVVLTFIIIFDYTGYQKALRRLNTVLSIRSRCDEIYEAERTDLVRPKPLPAFLQTPAPEEASAAPAPAAPEGEPAPKTPAPVILPEEVPAEAPAEPVKEEPVVPEIPEPEVEPVVPAEPKESVFESLTPEDAAEG